MENTPQTKYVLVGENILMGSYVVIKEDGKLYKATDRFIRPIFQTTQGLVEGSTIAIDSHEGGAITIRLGTKIDEMGTINVFPERVGPVMSQEEYKEKAEKLNTEIADRYSSEVTGTLYVAPEPKPEVISRPVYYNKLSMFLCDSNDKPIMEIIEDNDLVGQFIADAINNYETF